MKKYQLADQVHGNFGEVFDSYEAAEAALEDEVGINLAYEAEVISIKLEKEGREIPSDEELSEMARESLLNFLSIEEVEEE